ncbi:MAG TPA: hypothetical protein V6D20_12890, partial [Candidatus Obscuribacterales bacterium]
LPSPDKAGHLRYREGFNKFGANPDLPGLSAYSPANFDNDSLANSPLSSESGTGKYYSPLNDVGGLHRNLIPESEGWAYTQVRYQNDGRGRPERQSGVGEAFEMDAGRVTKYIYSTPTEQELWRLFGTNVGNVSHYRKVVTTDPNGQSSVAYTDQEGRTIATALLGTNPLALEALPELANSLKTESLAHSNTLSPDGRTMSISHTIANVIAGTRYDFEYNISSMAAQLNADVCLGCEYELAISITDPTGKAVPLNCTDITYSPSYTRLIGQAECLGDVASLSFSSTFNHEGSYRVIKTLRLLSADYSAIREQVNLMTKEIQEEMKAEYPPIDPSQCDICLDCEDPGFVEIGPDGEEIPVKFDPEVFIEETAADMDCEHILDEIREDIRVEWEEQGVYGYEATQEDLEASDRYCEYTYCVLTRESKIFDTRMTNAATWSEALDAGLANPLGMSGDIPEGNSDAFFFDGPGMDKGKEIMADSLMHCKILDSLGNTQVEGSIWEVTDPEGKGKDLFIEMSATS